jgi:hypothetical protein
MTDKNLLASLVSGSAIPVKRHGLSGLVSSGGNGGFTPNSISDLWAWFKCESDFLTLSGDSIMVWNPQDEDTDKQLISDTTGVAPDFADYNSRGIAQFDGTEVMHTNDDSHTITQPMTFAIALKFPTAVNYSTIFDVDDTSGGRIVHRNYQTSDKLLQIANSANYESSDEGVISATWGTEIIVANGTSTKWRINGIDVAPGGIDVSDNFNPLTIGSDYRALAGGSLNMVGDFMHFIIYDKALDDDEIAELEEWLANEVGL